LFLCKVKREKTKRRKESKISAFRKTLQHEKQFRASTKTVDPPHPAKTADDSIMSASTARSDFFSITDPVQKDQARQLIAKMQTKILYSEKYFDTDFEYRHVILPKELSKLVPRARLMEEGEWRQLGVQQSVGWKQYMIHKPEPHILLFKRNK